MSGTPRGTAPLPILLLTASPLLRAAVTRTLRAGAATGEAFALHTVMARERELLGAHAEIAPRVALIPVASTGSGADERALALIARLVRDWSVPIVALGVREGGSEGEEAASAAACRRYGALEYLPHARWTSDPVDLCARIAMAARIKILRPLDTAHAEPPSRSSSAVPRAADRAATPAAPTTTIAPTGMIGVVGASAGGPEALRALLAALPPHVPAPLIIVQHLPPNFGAALATDLGRFTRGGVALAAVGDLLTAGRILLVPGRQALIVEGGRVVALPEAMAEGVHGQAIDRTMISVAAAYGAGACGVILSGMGEDGVRGLAAIKAGGGRTFGQDAGSSQVYGMPRRAAEAGMLDQIGSPAILGNLLGRAFTGPPYGGAPTAQPRAALEH